MKRPLSLVLLGLAILVALAGPPPARAQYAPPGVNPTHWWTYRLTDPPYAPSDVYAEDQFHPGGIAISVDSLVRLVNWVHKDGSPVVPDTLTHYTWWNIPDKLPTPRTVQITNQFGSFAVNVSNLEFMLVPALKNAPTVNQTEALPLANHYLCYRAVGFPGPGRAVGLDDEWRHDAQVPLALEYICNPCLKEHLGNTYPPVDTTTHLALFAITPTSDLFGPTIKDQFLTGIQTVQQSPIEYLIVPSSKTEMPTPTRKASWGRVKSIYR